MVDYDQGKDPYVEGFIRPIRHQLLDAGLPFNATGMTLDLILKDKAGTAVTVTGDVAWEDATVSKAVYTPDAADMTAAGSPYRLHWQVVPSGVTVAAALASGAQVIPYPEGEARTITVHKAGGA